MCVFYNRTQVFLAEVDAMEYHTLSDVISDLWATVSSMVILIHVRWPPQAPARQQAIFRAPQAFVMQASIFASGGATVAIKQPHPAVTIKATAASWPGQVAQLLYQSSSLRNTLHLVFQVSAGFGGVMHTAVFTESVSLFNIGPSMHKLHFLFDVTLLPI